MQTKLSVQFCGASGTVTGSQYRLIYENKGQHEFCVDSGFFQLDQDDVEYQNNKDLLFDAKKIETIIVTHAHLDHVGRLPLLYKEGFRGRVISTPITQQLAEIVMLDSSKHQRGKEYDPLYDDNDVDGILSLFETYEYEKSFKIVEGLSGEFFEAGHILGSAWVEIIENSSSKKVIFSGDLGNYNKPYIKDFKSPTPDPNTKAIFIETTYGNRNHKESNIEKVFTEAINHAIKTDSKVMIPSFAVQRSQEIIHILTQLIANGKIPKITIYLDSPMAIKVNEVFRKAKYIYDTESKKQAEKNRNPLNLGTLVETESREDSKKLNISNQFGLIIAGSGMVTGGRILHHIKFHAKDKNSYFIITGYCAEGTTGRLILDGERSIMVNNQLTDINSTVLKVEGLSGHADSKGLMKWLGDAVHQQYYKQTDSQLKLFLVHGDDESRIAFKDLYQGNMKGVHTIMPQMEDINTIW